MWVNCFVVQRLDKQRYIEEKLVQVIQEVFLSTFYLPFFV